MNKNLFEPPMQNIELEFTEETFKDVNEKDIKNFQKSDKFKEYVNPVLDREKSLKKQKIKDWWWSKGATILSLLFGLIASIASIITLVLQVLE